MIDDHGRFLIHFHGFTNCLGSLHSGVGVQMGTRFIQQIEICFSTQANGDTDRLQLSTRESSCILLQKFVNLKWTNHRRVEFSLSPLHTEFTVQPVLHSSSEFRFDMLWFVGDLCFHRTPSGIHL